MGLDGGSHMILWPDEGATQTQVVRPQRLGVTHFWDRTCPPPRVFPRLFCDRECNRLHDTSRAIGWERVPSCVCSVAFARINHFQFVDGVVPPTHHQSRCSHGKHVWPAARCHSCGSRSTRIEKRYCKPPGAAHADPLRVSSFDLKQQLEMPVTKTFSHTSTLWSPWLSASITWSWSLSTSRSGCWSLVPPTQPRVCPVGNPRQDWRRS